MADFGRSPADCGSSVDRTVFDYDQDSGGSSKYQETERQYGQQTEELLPFC